MYSVVFGSVWVKCGVLLLLAFLLLQPASMAFANTEEQSSENEVSEAPEVEDSNESEGVGEASQVSDVDTPEEETTDVGSETTEPEYSDIVLTEGEELGSSDIEQSDTGDTAETDPETGTGTEDVTVYPETSDDQEEEASSDNDQNDEQAEEAEAHATSTEAATTTENLLIVDHNANQLQFDQKQCASVGDGAFYCSSANTSSDEVQSGVFAAPDSDGDMEIFIRLNGKQQQLTSNSIDDNAPFYDALSERIVWHAMLNDRYQIMSYDMNTQEITQLTSSAYNNMEPVAYGNITMYQSWLDNNWEIVRNEGGNEERLTHNTQHDVSPNIRGGYTVWQSQFAEGWQVAVYDQETGHIEYVASEGGAKVENPRFVLVYDSTNDAGDIQTVGYDFDNKRSFTLNSIPADLPEELPDPDQTGETRALIQSKHTIRGSEIEETDIVPTPNTSNGSSTATSSDNAIPAVDMTASSTLAASSSAPVSLPVEDLVIPSVPSATTTQDISHIPDILIPPLEATSTAEVR